MAYKLTLNYYNGYNCSCCYRSWSNNEIYDDLTQVANAIHYAKFESHDDLEDWEVVPCGELSSDEKDDLDSKLERLKDERENKIARAQAKEKYENETKRLKEQLATIEKKLADNRHLYNPDAIRGFESEISHLRFHIAQREKTDEL